jgi:hypothetical protein
MPKSNLIKLGSIAAADKHVPAPQDKCATARKLAFRDSS